MSEEYREGTARAGKRRSHGPVKRRDDGRGCEKSRRGPGESSDFAARTDPSEGDFAPPLPSPGTSGRFLRLKSARKGEAANGPRARGANSCRCFPQWKMLLLPGEKFPNKLGTVRKRVMNYYLNVC